MTPSYLITISPPFAFPIFHGFKTPHLIESENNIFEEELRNIDRMWMIHFRYSLQLFHLCSCFVWECFFWMICLGWWVWSLVVGFANFNYWTHCSLFCISVIQSTLHFLSVSFCDRQISPTIDPGSRSPSTLMAKSC